MPTKKNADAPRGGEFMFVSITQPSDMASFSQKVRSYAARNSLARRQRVSAYQSNHPVASSSRSKQKPDPPKSLSVIRPATISPVTPLSAARTDPFHTFARQVSPVEESLIKVFVKERVLWAVACLPNMQMQVLDQRLFWDALSKYWVQTAMSDPAMLASIFLLTHRYLANSLPSPLDRNHSMMRALIYKIECINRLNDTIAKEKDKISNETITKAMALASDATYIKHYDEAKRHTKAVALMLRKRGEPSAYGPKAANEHNDMDSGDPLEKLVIYFGKEPKNDNNSTILGSVRWGNVPSKPETDKTFFYHVGDWNEQS